MSMNSIILHPSQKRSKDRYDPLKLTKLPIPTPGDGEILIKIHYAALNHRDLFIRQGLYPGIGTSKSCLGADCSGVVVKGTKKFSPGTKVILNPAINWEKKSKTDYFSVLGLLPEPGTLSEFICIDERQVFFKPEHLAFEEGASLPLAGLTAFRACFTKGEIKKDSVVFIPGIGGGVALFALQFCIAVGAKVVVSSSSEEKIEKAISLGALFGVNYKKNGWVETLKQFAVNDSPFSHIIDGSGGDENYSSFLKILTLGGKIITYGSTQSSNLTLLLPNLFLKQIEIKGTSMGSSEEFEEMIGFIEKYKIKPIISKIFVGLENFESAFEHMRNSSQFGKIVEKNVGKILDLEKKVTEKSLELQSKTKIKSEMENELKQMQNKVDAVKKK
ncbi:hypothetical protein HK099_006011 [Clydaea vesicula]|uniref:Enoyl reductase (ER) domain-containing protein n=1 Tax=Clydaea vesicula TaxID=447962 RepID=A0AAD5TYQ0_9FUNG|nr:hypothetical protein HK099_006011 [Clydaea vesicula]